MHSISPTDRNAPEVFDFRGNDVRVVLADDGEPRWVAADVAKILGYRMSSDMTRWLEEDEKGTHKVRTSQVNGTFETRSMAVITESGLYAAVLKSRRPEAVDFRRWVTREVLPSIRRHGGYLTPAAAEQALTDPDFIIRLATDLKEERARRQELEAPAHSWNALAAPGGDYSVAAAAKVLSRDPDIEIGRDRLFKHMHKIGWIFRTTGRRAHWEAYQDKAINTGRLTHKLGGGFINEKTGEWEQAQPTIRVTPKGLHELHKSLGGTTTRALEEVTA
ncbi:BRO family protein [Corynebacterium hansenii]|uniref:BRO family protein n=1 Tax=Corynebacterium hansenii TaxID=394964 RepID=A0ABV7ZL42_9CORY|nr:phage antirepressor KilAC domain-containing protein [Corynebacterium hansenii]WJY99279.1 hypothetical protein CHAN_03255 [Corynebacterium hansenii]